MERRDILDAPDGVRYGVSCGVGKDVAAGPLKYSSSLSQSAIVLYGGSGLVPTNCYEKAVGRMGSLENNGYVEFDSRVSLGNRKTGQTPQTVFL